MPRVFSSCSLVVAPLAIRRVKYSFSMISCRIVWSVMKMLPPRLAASQITNPPMINNASMPRRRTFRLIRIDAAIGPVGVLAKARSPEPRTLASSPTGITPEHEGHSKDSSSFNASSDSASSSMCWEQWGQESFMAEKRFDLVFASIAIPGQQHATWSLHRRYPTQLRRMQHLGLTVIHQPMCGATEIGGEIGEPI